MLKPKNGYIYVCKNCGEQVSGKALYCANCTTQPKRKAMFDANAKILKENKAKGYKIPDTLPNWK